ncbi:MAG: hypothetical protein Q9204_005638 [Flavoplaca sp. TL-2023a]
MEQFRQIFEHNTEHQIIICKTHPHAIDPAQIEKHLRRCHQPITVTQSKCIARVVQNLPNVARNPLEIDCSGPIDSPIKGLPEYHDALWCSQCPQVFRHRSSMEKHGKKEHQWCNYNGRGGNAHKRAQNAYTSKYQTGQRCQQLFKTGEWPRYIGIRASTIEASSSHCVEGIADKLFSQYQDIIKDAKAQRAVENNDIRSVPNAWLAFTGWPSHLSQFQDKEQIIQYIQPTKEVENEIPEQDVGLEDACRGTRRMIRTAFSICKPNIVGKTALESVNRRETGTESNDRPFYAGQQVKTIRKYSNVLVEILRYIWRTASEKDRPKYEMTERQRKCLQKVRDVTAPGSRENVDVEDSQGESRTARKGARREAIEEAFSTFWVAMFDHELKDSEFKSGIISGLAVLGIDTQNGSWKTPLNFTPILSAIVAVMRALVVYRAWRFRQQSIENGIRTGLSGEEAADQAPAVVDGVDKLVQRFMTLREYGGRISPMDRILRMRTYGLKIRMTTKAGGTVSWNGDKVLVNKIEFSMDDVRTVVHGLNETVRNRLQDLLFVGDGQAELPPLDIKKLCDNHAELSEGWSFLADSRNQFAVNGEEWMWKRLFREPRMERYFVDGSLDYVQSREDMQWNGKNIERYFRKVRRLKEELQILVHLSGGAPARATSLISVQTQNGPEGRGQRGMFIDNGMVDIVTAYDKGSSISQKVKIIHRYMPTEVGMWLVYIVWLLDPWVEQLQAMSRGQTEFSSFMWEAKPEEDWRADEDEDEAYAGGGGDDAEPGDESDSEGESTPQEEPKNVDGFWDTDRVRNVMRRETRKRIDVGIGVSDWRHAYPAIQREFTKDNGVREALDSIYDDRTPHGRRMEDAIAEQAGHSRYMEDMIYGLLLTESPTTTTTEKNMFRKVSVDWHRFLRFPSAWEEHNVDPTVQRQLEMEKQQAQMRRWKQMREVDVEGQAKRLYGPDASFRGVQRTALDAIVRGDPRVLVVMRTGGGKSWMFMLPAAGSTDGVTVVIVPTISLRQDLMDRCNRDGIPCEEWNGSRPPYHASIVLVTPESAVSMAFGRFIDEKRTMHQLERIVIDECHTVLESSADWRPKVLQLCEMARKGVQVVYLTATLPPSKEPAFFDIIGVQEADMTMVRDDTSRPNVAYSVMEYEKSQENEAVRELVEEKKAQYPAPGQIVVYCKKVEQAKRLAQELQCSVYHRNVGGEPEKKGILRRLTGQQERVFTATNALGLGVDAPSIRVVIHVGIREAMAQYAQESGRAGRDGEPSEAIIMRANRTSDHGQSKQEQGWRTEETMRAFLRGESCRRIAMDRHMDGRGGRVGCERAEERCDVCRGIPRGTKRRRVVVNNHEEGDGPAKRQFSNQSGQDRVVREQFTQHRQQYDRIQRQERRSNIGGADIVEMLERQLQSWQSRCETCMVGEREHGDHKNWRECPYSDEDRRSTQQVWQELGKVEFEAFAHCKFCWAPQAICHSWEDISHSGPQRFRKRHGRECQFPEVVRSAVAAILGLRTEQVADWIDEEASKSGLTVKKNETEWTVWRRWFGRKINMGGVEMSGLCRLLSEIEVPLEVQDV